MDLVKILQPCLKPSDDFILLGAGDLGTFEFVQHNVNSFTILERDEAKVLELQKTQSQVFLLKNIDDALDFFIEEMNEVKLPNIFVYVNPYGSQQDLQFYRQIEVLLTGRSFYSLDLHFTLLGQTLSPAPQPGSQVLHLKDGLTRIQHQNLPSAEQHLFHILDEIVR